MKSLLLTLVMALNVLGCANGNCRTNNGSAEAPHSDLSDKLDVQSRVKVYRYDGTLQCGQGKAIKVDDMKKDLQDIPIYSVENKADGLMHMQMCGAVTGKANVYQIDGKNLERAKGLGFKLWTFE